LDSKGSVPKWDEKQAEMLLFPSSREGVAKRLARSRLSIVANWRQCMTENINGSRAQGKAFDRLWARTA
jgi:hypothetical protein